MTKITEKKLKELGFYKIENKVTDATIYRTKYDLYYIGFAKHKSLTSKGTFKKWYFYGDDGEL